MKSILLMVNSLLLILMMLISVAFLTLMERKILGFMQIRLGPNKIGPMGIIQPISDAIKLYTKEYNKPMISNKLMMFFFPVLSLFLSLVSWIFMPYLNKIFIMNIMFILLMFILGLGVYSTLFMGWVTNSNYSNIGSIRSAAQTISYEISLSFIIMPIFIISLSMNFKQVMNLQMIHWNLMISPIFFMWLLSCLAELNRTPFDLAEAESELVSGFNTEFSGGKFAMIFMAEYTMIMFLSMLTTIMFLGVTKIKIIMFLFSTSTMFFIIWARATLPRIRYDKLMMLTWLTLLPSALLMNMIFPMMMTMLKI